MEQLDEQINESEKYCEGCDLTLPRSMFHKNGKTVMPVCSKCRAKQRASVRYPRKEGPKYCPRCGIDHPDTDFDSDSTQPDGLQSYCKKARHIQRLKYLSTYDGFTKNLFKDLRGNAKRRNITVNITVDNIHQLYIKQKKRCAITRIKLRHRSSERESDSQHILNKWNISVDRIDSNKGYEPDNIQLVCAIVNRMKTSLSDDEFFLVCGSVAQINFNLINKIKISKINDKMTTNYLTNKNYSIITEILNDQIENNKKYIKLETPMQKTSCKLEGFINKLYLNTKHNQQKRAKDLDLNITSEDISDLYVEQQGACFITQVELTHIGYQNTGTNHTMNNWNISIDRIDSTKGYTKDNIQLLCGIVNRMKTDLTTNELLILCDKIYRNNFMKINHLIVKKINKHFIYIPAIQN